MLPTRRGAAWGLGAYRRVSIPPRAVAELLPSRAALSLPHAARPPCAAHAHTACGRLRLAPRAHRCVAQTDLGISSAQCSGLTVDQCSGGGGDEPPVGPGGGGGGSGGGGGAGGGGQSPAAPGNEPGDGGGGVIPTPLLRRIGVGIHVLNIADIDLQNGRFYADFEVRCPPSRAPSRGARGAQTRPRSGGDATTPPRAPLCSPRPCRALFPFPFPVFLLIRSICTRRWTSPGATGSTRQTRSRTRSWPSAARCCAGSPTSSRTPPG